MSALKQFVREIHRRSVWQVLGIYAVGAWIALQVVDVLANNFGLPTWFPPFALGLLVLGLPVVLATAFVQEGAGPRTGDDAGTRTDPLAPSEADAIGSAADRAAPHGLFTWRNALLGGMAAFALWGIVAAGWLLLRPAAGDTGPAATASVPGAGATSADADESRQSIAVLPFTNRSAGTEEDAGFFASGIHDDILTQLSKIDALKVISRTSVMQYEGTQKTIGQIGHELGVATVLEGSVQRAGDRVRVNVQLIDSGTDEHLWAETYDQELTAANVFAIQSDVARKIADALETTLAPEVEERIEQRPTESLEAYELYLQGRYVMDRATRQDREDAIQLFRRAIEEDPDFALAHSWLATSYTTLLGSAFLDPAEALPSARAAAERALEIDPDLPEAHTALAEVLVSEGRWDDAEREFVRAIELNPGNARAHERYGLLIVDRGRFGAARSELEVAAELDPTSRVIRANLAFVRFLLRDFEGTENEALRMIELEPDFDYGYYILAAAQSFQGRHEEAIVTAARSVELASDDLYNHAALGLVHARAGNRDRALGIAAQIEKGGGSLKEIALIYGQLGELDRAFEYLERTYQSDPGDLLFLMSDPSADPLRDDPRFDELAERAGLK